MEFRAERKALPARDDELHELCGAYGFDYYLLASFPRADKSGLFDGRVSSNWPRQLLNDYEKADALRRSRAVATLRQSVMPVVDTGEVFFQDSDGKEIPGLAALFRVPGFENILCFTLHDAAMEPYIVAFAGKRRSPDASEIREIYFDVMQELDRTSALVAESEGPRERLTAREIECLRWSAAGKSSDEIAIILAISSHTVISYLKSAMRKLDAVSRMQAIARAYRFRML